jgi:rhodanese-related sulfurtransferase
VRFFFENRDSIQLIDVVTRNDFDNTHAAGSSISEVLQARPSTFYDYQPQYEYTPLNENRHFLNRDQDRSIQNNGIDVKFEMYCLGKERTGSL